jgi:hypothetical protein
MGVPALTPVLGSNSRILSENSRIKIKEHPSLENQLADSASA